MKFYLGVTDNNWYQYLSRINPEDVNFWQPRFTKTFKVLQPGEPFLFKLKRPFNCIAGVGFFSSQSLLPLSVAWDVFGNRNGSDTYEQFTRMIMSIRGVEDNLNPTISCLVLTNPIFFAQSDWIILTSSWAGINQGKSYSLSDSVGSDLWKQVQVRLEKYLSNAEPVGLKSQLILSEPEAQYGNSILTKVRLGQGAFRVLVTDSYNRRCAISGEKTLPVLEAAHIKPYALSGPHFISNGLLLRSDMHKLFDAGYITITNDHKIEVSKRIKEEFQNGREYYQYHGKSLTSLPNRLQDQPDISYLEWHNLNIYKQ